MSSFPVSSLLLRFSIWLADLHITVKVCGEKKTELSSSQGFALFMPVDIQE